jgi:oligoribonuclease (3'-5' exoribonuclease)
MSTTAKEERPTWLVWLDLETTGSDENADPILEMGLVITDEALNEVGAVSWVVAGDPEVLRERAAPVVQDMHDANGLWRELSEGVAQEWVEDAAITLLRQFGRRHDFVLAGSGVSHFDRRFLAVQMPILTKWFRYYSIDVGVLRRSLELIGRTDALLPPQDKAHRALADARYHLEEMRHIKSVLGGAS